MKIGYFAIGSELLWEGKRDKNRELLSKILSNYGLEVSFALTLKDDIKDLLFGFEFFKKANLIVISGGLGPTKDDLTRLGLAKFFNCKLKFEENLWDELKEKYKSLGLKIPEISKNQFLIPSVGRALKNQKGSAPGIFIKKDKITLFSFPGVPEEFQFMLENYLEPLLQKKVKLEFFKKTFNLAGVFESYVETKLQNFYKKFPKKNLTILASQGIVTITIKEKDENIFKKMEREIKNIFKEEIYGYNGLSLSKKIQELLNEKNLTLSIAESCTGGGLSYELVKLPGISKNFFGGIVAYSNEIKEKILGVSKDILRKYGAVSYEVAKEMAEKVKEKFKTDIGLAVTGIAGPEGGTKIKPLGTVYICVCYKDKEIIEKFQFTGSRERIQKFSINFALNLIRRVLV